jgi:hypothetical protein
VIQEGRNSVREKFPPKNCCQEKRGERGGGLFVQLEEEKYIDGSEAPETFEGFLSKIGAFLKVKFNNC